jgi:hypothetical protein
MNLQKWRRRKDTTGVTAASRLAHKIKYNPEIYFVLTTLQEKDLNNLPNFAMLKAIRKLIGEKKELKDFLAEKMEEGLPW